MDRKKILALLSKLEEVACSCEADIGWSCYVHGDFNELRRELKADTTEPKWKRVYAGPEPQWRRRICGVVFVIDMDTKGRCSVTRLEDREDDLGERQVYEAFAQTLVLAKRKAMRKAAKLAKGNDNGR